MKESSNRDTYSIIKGMTIEKAEEILKDYEIFEQKRSDNYSTLLTDILSDKDSLVLEFYRVS